MTQYEHEVVVIGAGIVGLAAALGMRQLGFSTAIVDAGPLTADTSIPDLRVYAVNEASQTLLKQLGGWSRIDATRISSYRHMQVWDGTHGAQIDFDARLIQSNSLGVIVEESILKQALLEQALEQQIVCYPKQAITWVQERAQDIQIGNATAKWTAKGVIIADGARSAIREILKVEVTSWPYHQQAVIATVQNEKPHQHTTYQVFHREGPLAFLPLADPHLCSIVWSTTLTQSQKLMTCSKEEFNQILTQAFSAKLGQSNVCSARHTFPLIMRHAKQYHGARWLLMGDAAHSIHPMAGLGLNIGLADVSQWLELISKLSHPSWSSKSLGAYQRQRKHDVWQLIMVMQGLHTLFRSRRLPISLLRSVGLTACNHSEFLKRFFIQTANATKGN